MSDEKLSELNAELKVLGKEQEILTKHHDKLFDVLDSIKTDLSKLVSIEERQVAITGSLDRIESHASKQGREIQDLKEEQHDFDIRLTRLEKSTESNTEVRKSWGRIGERVIGALIIAAMGAFIAVKL